ncbi:MAG: hypothetical protein ACRD1I_04235, partial [Terriglobia bacterium]
AGNGAQTYAGLPCNVPDGGRRWNWFHSLPGQPINKSSLYGARSAPNLQRVPSYQPVILMQTSLDFKV